MQGAVTGVVGAGAGGPASPASPPGSAGASALGGSGGSTAVARGAALRRLRSAARPFVRLRHRAAGVTGRAHARWRSSLQLRVVTATLVISGVVVAVLGFFLLQQFEVGVLQNAIQSAQSVADQGLGLASSQRGVYLGLNSNSKYLMAGIVKELQAKGDPASNFGIAVTLPKDKTGNPVFSGGFSTGIRNGEVPAELAQRVEAEPRTGNVAMRYEFAVLPYGPSGRPVHGLAFGAPFGNYYQLYYFFPLTQEQQLLGLAQRTLLLVGVALVCLLAAIASLVTRWVVAPVRQAAQAAQRLSTGNLDERVPVRGTDDLAALAASFNNMAASLKDKMAELEGLSQVQRQFVSDVSHELRTPLTTIRIAADVLFAAKAQLQPSATRSAELLQSQLERFEALLIDLLEISRYDANAATLEPEPVDLCDVVRHSADVAQQLAERRGAKIEFRLPAEPCVAEVDRRRVARILRNLLVNAVEHGENRDAVVTVAGDSNAVCVAVRDFGIGLAPGEERLVFDRFWRADPARARTSGGTGLGLSIALEDARLHGGWLEAWGAPGSGSVFRLTLPRIAGGDLAGSPLPLCPDDADLDAVSSVMMAVADPPPAAAGAPAAKDPAAKDPAAEEPAAEDPAPSRVIARG